MMLFNAIKNNLKLSMPILLTRLLGITSNLIAMLLIAKLGPVALSASALVMGIFSVCILLVMAFSFSVCALIAQAYAKKQNDEVGKIFTASLILNTLLALPFMLAFYNVTNILLLIHQPPAVAALTGDYFRGLLIGYLPMIWANIIEQFFVGLGKPRYIVYLSVLGLLVMPLLSKIFIFGAFGIPAMGMLGAGYAVSATSIFSLFFLLSIIVIKKWMTAFSLFHFSFKKDYPIFKKLFLLGWPTALQFGGEFSAYSFMTIMMGWVSVEALAAQQILLQFTSVIIMIPTSVSQATAVLVGQAYGQNNESEVRYCTQVSLWVVTVLMLLIGVVYMAMPMALARLYLDVANPINTKILTITKIFFLITAVTQCFDGVRNVLAGAFRGMQETKSPMQISLISLWLIGIPLAYVTGFLLPGGAVGIRFGFAIGVIVGTFLLAGLWYRRKMIATKSILQSLP